MNKDCIAEVVADLANLSLPPDDDIDALDDDDEALHYIVPEPPVPGKTAWSIAPW